MESRLFIMLFQAYLLLQDLTLVFAPLFGSSSNIYLVPSKSSERRILW